MKIEKEYKRLKSKLEGLDENLIELNDGTILEAARLKVEIDELHEIIKETGLIKVNPNNPSQQKELPVSKVIIKVRANYLNYIAKLSNLLGKNLNDEEEEDDLEDFE